MGNLSRERLAALRDTRSWLAAVTGWLYDAVYLQKLAKQRPSYVPLEEMEGGARKGEDSDTVVDFDALEDLSDEELLDQG